MYAPTLDAPLNTYFIPEANVSSVPVSESQADPSQTYVVIPTDGIHTDWSVLPQVGGQVTAGNAPEIAQEDDRLFFLEADMEGYPDVPFGTPVLTCGLAGGWHCALPLDGSTKSVRRHLRLHGYRYPQRRAVQCPWVGCSDTLMWMNMPRHIQSVHLGVRFKCLNCGKPYTRFEGLAKHAASMKCGG